MNWTPLAIFLAAAPSVPALSLPVNQVSEKLDSIVVFAPVNAKTSNQPDSLKFELDGETRSVYFAAFSPSAVQKLIEERLTPQNPALAKSLKFAPFSLSKFDSIVQSSLQDNKNARVVYVPDPDQAQAAQKLLIQQGVKQADTVKIVQEVPFVFCPSPTIKVTSNSVSLKGKTFIPCSTDHLTIQSIIDKGEASDPQIKENNTKLIAIPIINFVSMLTNGTFEDVGEIRVLTSPASVETVNTLRNAGKPQALQNLIKVAAAGLVLKSLLLQQELNIFPILFCFEKVDGNRALPWFLAALVGSVPIRIFRKFE